MEKACRLVAGLVKRCEMSGRCPCGLKCYLHFNFFGSYSYSSVTCGQQTNVTVQVLNVTVLLSWSRIRHNNFFGMQLLPIDISYLILLLCGLCTFFFKETLYIDEHECSKYDCKWTIVIPAVNFLRIFF